MAIYEYVCPNCGIEDERMVAMAEADKQSCDNCPDEATLKRKMSVPGYVWSPSKERK